LVGGLEDGDETHEQRRRCDESNRAEAEHVELARHAGGDRGGALRWLGGEQRSQPIKGSEGQASARDESTPQGYERRRAIRRGGVDVSHYTRLTHWYRSDSLAAS
jgi:hypothetical protein